MAARQTARPQGRMPKPKPSARRTALFALAVLAVAAVLIAAGVAQGDALSVFRKASLVCYECIGIG